MKKWIALMILTIFMSSFSDIFATAEEINREPVPLARAHAHNDYEHPRPLFDALDHGFTSVEADVWLEDGELLVAHNQFQVQPHRTLKSLYLEPLMAKFKENDGSIYKDYKHEFILWIDIKSEDKATYLEIHKQLQEYEEMLTKFGPSGVKPGAVTVYISGNRPRDLIENQTVRYAAFDGRMSDLGSGASSEFMPVISDNWVKHFTWLGVGPMPRDQREKLNSIVAKAHGNGQKVRFWATPDLPLPAREAIWMELLKAKVDFINTDHLADLEEFLKQNDPNPSKPYITFEKKKK